MTDLVTYTLDNGVATIKMDDGSMGPQYFVAHQSNSYHTYL